VQVRHESQHLWNLGWEMGITLQMDLNASKGPKEIGLGQETLEPSVLEQEGPQVGVLEGRMALIAACCLR